MRARFYGSSKIKAIFIPFSGAKTSQDLFPNYEISIEKNKRRFTNTSQYKMKVDKTQVWAS